MGIINWYYYLTWQRNTETEKRIAKEKKDAERQSNRKQSRGKVHPAQNRQPSLLALQQSIDMLADEVE